MGTGVRRAGRKSDLSPMEATPPAFTAGLADARRVPSTLPDMERTAPATSSRSADNSRDRPTAHTCPFRPGGQLTSNSSGCCRFAHFPT
jgi:hypothetical protein